MREVDNRVGKWQDSKKDSMMAIDLVSSIILIMFSVSVFLFSLEMPRPGGWSSAPGLVPLFISTSLFFMALGLLIPSIRNQGFSVLVAKSRGVLSRQFLNDTTTKRTMWIILLTAFYVFILLNKIRFEFASFIYLASTFYVFKKNLGWRNIVLISSIAPLVISAGFRVVCTVFVPGNSIFDWLLIYLK